VTLNGKQLAAELGVSPPMIVKYLKAGKITRGDGGLFDLDVVRQQLAHNNGSWSRGSMSRGLRHEKPAPAEGSITKHRPAATRATSPSPVDGADYSKTEWEKFALAERVRQARLKNDQLEGSLVDKEEVAAATEARIRADAQALLGWPKQVAATLAAELGLTERQLFVVLDREVRKFMKQRSMVAE
jgi:hypothetical protein